MKYKLRPTTKFQKDLKVWGISDKTRESNRVAGWLASILIERRKQPYHAMSDPDSYIRIGGVKKKKQMRNYSFPRFDNFCNITY